MADPIMNPVATRAAASEADGVALSRDLLHAARELGDDGLALGRVEALAARLHAVDPAGIAGDDARTAFWLNVYNALVKHVMHVENPRGNLLLKLGLFNRAAYRVGAHRYSLSVIEHGLLRGNRKAPGSLFRVARDGDPALRAAVTRLDPRIHFALNCGARSCPPIRSYEPAKLDAQLETATRAYFEGEARVDRAQRTLTLPKLCKYYRQDFGDDGALVAFAARHLEDADAGFVRSHAGALAVRYGEYDWAIGPGATAD